MLGCGKSYSSTASRGDESMHRSPLPLATAFGTWFWRIPPLTNSHNVDHRVPWSTSRGVLADGTIRRVKPGSKPLQSRHESRLSYIAREHQDAERSVGEDSGGQLVWSSRCDVDDLGRGESLSDGQVGSQLLLGAIGF